MKANKNQNYVAILLLAGNGTRLFETIKEKKQFYKINDQELFVYPLISFEKAGFFEKIVLVVDSEDLDQVRKIVGSHKEINPDIVFYVIGGKDRNASVYNALESLKKDDKDGIVFIHDAARPYLDEDVLHELKKASQKYDAVTTVIPVHDSLLKQDEKGNITYLDRANTYLIQTPQVFDYKKILQIYETGYDSNDTDDYKKAIRAALSHTLVRGKASMFKVTEADDLSLAKKVLS
ncbi:MAG: IspD/TarI family cytidylyltransferase [Bacilli bacterium]|jgi:2-C-methyl-D-erythritol 4-phosphate cytidylyltransferase